MVLTASDSHSGVVSTQWRVNGGSWNNTSTVTVSLPGTHTVEYRSADGAGNAEETQVATFVLMRRVEETDPRLVIGGSWSYFSDQGFSNSGGMWAFSAGRSVTVRFEGTRIDWIGSVGSAYGFATLTIDGGAPSLVNLYSPIFKAKQSLYSSGDLVNGTHTLVLTTTGTYSAPSTGSRVYVDAFDVIGEVIP